MSNQIHILIVEDEVLLAQDLQLRLETNSGYKTILAQSYTEAVEVLSTSKIDFLIIDITLKGQRSGIDLAATVNESFHIPFIFLTSHSDQKTFENAKLFRPNAYLLKPFNDRMISMSIDLALEPPKDSPHYESGAVQGNGTVLKPLYIKQDNIYKKVNIEDIMYLEADSNYTVIHTKDVNYTYSMVMRKIQEKLKYPFFLRIHRSYIININYVTSFDSNSIILDERYKLPVSKQNRDEMFKHFEIL
ncbi:LytR/AlgR family response regulator transcription factor [Flammeovirga aprica]|uniref:Response regulator transcription factor n=1 Tax=Flammeovirga aprica JL-4 TaxID=694437 RepID=A0A7X9RX41_9BACT|nr:response regulator transcription factor [Flammeovirga aprica]NME70383.1 response regulator transcription factor [Flammeovirga aprica JL-4]